MLKVGDACSSSSGGSNQLPLAPTVDQPAQLGYMLSTLPDAAQRINLVELFFPEQEQTHEQLVDQLLAKVLTSGHRTERTRRALKPWFSESDENGLLLFPGGSSRQATAKVAEAIATCTELEQSGIACIAAYKHCQSLQLDDIAAQLPVNQEVRQFTCQSMTTLCQ